jgi:signal transduction histidine kinase
MVEAAIDAPVIHAPVARKRGRYWPLRLASTLTLVVLGAVVVASSLITLNVIRDQERLILQERTGEAAAVIGSAFTSMESGLLLLGEIASADQGRSQLFAGAARSLLANPKTQGLLVTTQQGTAMTVTASAGAAPAVGQRVSATQAELARRALSTTGMVSGLLPTAGPGRWLAFALGHAAGPGTATWEVLRLSAPTATKTSVPSVWGNLNIALYLSAHASPSKLIIATTKKLPLSGAQYPFRVGADTWLLVASSPSPLVGTLAEEMPWIILVIGGITALLVTVVLETVSRRRDYAAALVSERTASLRTALTELETAQTHLVRQERLAAVGELASTVGHELRNPLAVIMNVLYLLETGAQSDGNESMLRHVSTAKRETSAATLIVSDLLDYSASREPMLAPVQVADLIDEALSVVPPPAGVEITRQYAPEITISGDRDQIRQAVLNLITNGYDAMADGGALTVSAVEAEGSAQITVTDTGVGMDEETRESIFTPFYTTKARGIGLGLAVTRRVIEAHGGTITVESTPSAGTSFMIALPVTVPAASVDR